MSVSASRRLSGRSGAAERGLSGVRRSEAGSARRPEAGISRPLLLLVAASCGLIVANIYYIQPLLPDLDRQFGASSRVGFGVTATQLGYALGLIFLVPLGDLLAKRALAVSLLAASSVALVLAAVAWSPLVLVLALSFVGVSSVAVNVLIPFAATLASDHERGRVLGTMMTGLFLGVLLARTVSGALGQVAGWRTVYITAAVVAAVLAVVLFLALPALPVPEGSRSYPRLLRSVLSLIRQERFLRRRMLVGALGFASFQLLWTALPSLLAAAPFGYSTAAIGSFGLVGAAGVLCAQSAGRLQDRGYGHVAIGAFTLLLGAAWLVFAGPRHVWVIIVGIILLDIGVQGLHVLNQGRIYQYQAQVRARVTTAYMTAYFFGGSVGSLLALTVFPHVGWSGVCIAGGVLFAGTAALWFRDRDAKPSADLIT